MYSGDMLKYLRVVGGVDHTNRVIFFSVGNWLEILGGVPEQDSVYIKLFNQEIHR